MKNIIQDRFTKSSEETEYLADIIGRNVRGGETIELISDLGGGKTTFVRGFVRGAGSGDVVASPSYTISRQYDAGKFRIYHFDMYRLDEPGLISHEIEDALSDNSGVVMIEWPAIVDHVLPAKRLRVEIMSIDEMSRKVSISIPTSWEYLMLGLL